MRQGLLQLPAVAVPNRLQTQLQILVSRERARWDSMRTLPLALHTWADNIKLAVDNLMRPLALPLTGGLLSALLLFSVLVPTLGFHPVGGKDVPIRLYTAATLVEATPFDLSNDEAVVELYVDAKGQAMDYSIERGKVSPEMQADLNRLIFFSRCTPATWFGRPTSGTVLVSFRRIHYVVRG
ncbi:MAG TPA: hypothetical protein VMT86_00535 [Bryobacteraceae bacterium]|nr:hypothetical protein [Bryobacteraceae bacterium]